MSFFSLFTFFYCLYSNSNNLYQYLFIIPLIYSIANITFTVFLIHKETYGLNIIFYIAYVLIFIRYVLTPFFIIFSGKFISWGWGPNPLKGSMLFAEILMSLEIIIIYCTQYFSIKYYSKRYRNIFNNQAKSFTKNNCDHLLVLSVYALFSGTLVLCFQPSLLSIGSLIKNAITNDPTIFTGNDNLYGAFTILSDTFKKVIVIILFILLQKSYKKNKGHLYYFHLFWGISIILLSVLLNMGYNRLRIIFALVLGLYFTRYILGKIPLTFYVVLSMGLIIPVILISINKFSYAFSSSTSPVKSVIATMSGQFQDYFSGPRLVGQMIDMKKYGSFNINISTFINDFTGSLPFISNYVNQANRINYYFNIFNGMSNQSLIAPILGIGYVYFPAFPFLFSIIFEHYVIKLDFLMTRSNKISYKYIYAYMGYVCSMCMGYSTQNIYAQFMNAFIPLIILLKLNDVPFKARMGENKGKFLIGMNNTKNN